jgi:hypothetical protein
LKSSATVKGDIRNSVIPHQRSLLNKQGFNQCELKLMASTSDDLGQFRKWKGVMMSVDPDFYELNLTYLFKEALIKSFDRLRTNGNVWIPFVVSLSNHDRNPLVQSFLKARETALAGESHKASVILGISPDSVNRLSELSSARN